MKDSRNWCQAANNKCLIDFLPSLLWFEYFIWTIMCEVKMGSALLFIYLVQSVIEFIV